MPGALRRGLGRSRGGAGRWAIASHASLERRIADLSPEKKAVGFDVFDTLLVRRVEPEAIKQLVARRLGQLLGPLGLSRDWKDLYERRRRIERDLCAQSLEQGFDDEFSYSAMLNRWLLEVAVPPERVAEFSGQLSRHEAELEGCATEPVPSIAAVLARLRGRRLRLFFTSDFYLSQATVWGLLKRAGLAKYFDAGYVSSDGLLRKASGRLFRHVLNEERIAPRDLLFIGDNLVADVQRPNELGIDAIHLSDPVLRQRQLRLKLLGSLGAKNAYWSGALAEEILGNTLAARGASPGPSALLGRRLAPAYISFAEHVLERAVGEGFDAIFFCSREGALFHRLVRGLARAQGVCVPPMRYLGVSRKSTFLPSMEGLGAEELKRVLVQYKDLSGFQLIESLGLPVEEFEPLLRRAGFSDPAEPVKDLAESGALANFIGDPRVQERFENHKARARQLFHAYLRRLGYFNHDRVLVVDIGWKGSMIDNLVRSTRGAAAPQVTGCLFGTQEGVSQEFCPKRGYFFHGPDRDPIACAALDNVAVFEMYATANHGSVVGYEPWGNRVRTVTRYYPQERENWNACQREGQQAIREAFREYLRVRPLLAAAYERSAQEWRPYLQDRIRRLIQYPTSDEVAAFMQARHVESFGLFSVRAFADEAPSWREHRGGGIEGLYRAVRFTVWPAGMLRRMNLGLAQPAYALYDTWHRAHQW